MKSSTSKSKKKATPKKSYTVYILKCSDGSLYTGITNNLAKRLKAHSEGKSGAKYTRSRRPVVLVYKETRRNKGAALKREYAIKKRSRSQKFLLVGNQ